MDKRIAIVGAIGFAIIGIILLIRISQPLYGVSSLLACLACVGYLLSQGRTMLRVIAADDTLLYDFGWLATWGTAIAVYAMRPETYHRPLAFFIFMALSCGLVAAKVLRCRLTGRDTAITLTQTIAIGLSLVWTVTLMYPSLVGLDPWTHRSIVINGISTGDWLSFPIWHRAWYGFLAVTVKATGLEYRLASMLVSFIQVAAGASLLFLIGRRIAGKRVGLLAALTVSISSWCIFFGYWIIPNGLGLTLVLLAVYLVAKHNYDGGKWPIFAFAITLGLLLFTYPMAVVWLIALLAIWIILTLIRDRRLLKRHITLPITGVIAMIGVLWGIGFLQHMYHLVFLYGLNPTRIGTAPPPGMAPPPITPPPVQAGTFFIDTIAKPSWELAFNSSGMMLGFAIAIAGCLWLVHRRYRSTLSLFALLSFGLFLLAGIVPSLFGMSVIEHRWWYAAQVFGAIPVAIALFSLRKWGKGIIAVAIVMVLSFLMMVGLPNNMDNYTFSKNQLARYALTRGELDAAEWVLDKCDGNIGVDDYYTFAWNLIPESDDRFVGINYEILSNDYASLNCSVILMRDAIAYEPFAIGDGHVYELLYDPNEAIIEAGYKLAYSANGVNGYIEPTICNTWTIGASLPTARFAVTTNELPTLDGKIYIIGGINATQRVDNVTIYDIATSTYSAGTGYPDGIDGGVAGTAQVLWNEKIYVFGGVTQSKGWYVPHLRIYDIDTDTWSNGTDVPWQAEGMIATVDPTTGLIYVGGGCELDIALHDEWYRYDPVADTWTSLGTLPNTRGNSATFYYNGGIYITAGAGITGTTLLDTTWRYDIAADTWDTGLALLPTKVLMMANCFDATNAVLYLFGGRTSADHTYTDAVQVYDVDDDIWLNDEARCGFTSIPTSYGFSQSTLSATSFYIFGGWDSTTQYDILYEYTMPRE